MKWFYPTGETAPAKKCVNGTWFAGEHLIGTDPDLCLACGARRATPEKEFHPRPEET